LQLPYSPLLSAPVGPPVGKQALQSACPGMVDKTAIANYFFA